MSIHLYFFDSLQIEHLLDSAGCAVDCLDDEGHTPLIVVSWQAEIKRVLP